MCFVVLLIFFFFNDTATTEIYTLSLHDALPISPAKAVACVRERQRCEIGHSSGLSQANALAARAGRFGSSCLRLAAGLGSGKPRACKSSAVRPGGISPRARKSMHHRRKKYSCSSHARHIGRSHYTVMARLGQGNPDAAQSLENPRVPLLARGWRNAPPAAYSTTFGTTKKPSCAAGAFLMMSS